MQLEEKLDKINNNSNIPKIRASNMTQYKSKEPTNIYAPVIRKRDIDDNRVFRMGQIQGLKKNIDMRIEKNLNEKHVTH